MAPVTYAAPDASTAVARVAGTWIAAKGYDFMDISVDGAQLVAAAMSQLDLGTDLVKLYMDAPGGVKDA